MAENVLVTVTILLWSLTGAVAVVALKEFVRLRASENGLQSGGEMVKRELARKPVKKWSIKFPEAHVDLPVSKLIGRRHLYASSGPMPAGEVEIVRERFEKLRRRMAIHRNGDIHIRPAVPEYRLKM